MSKEKMKKGFMIINGCDVEPLPVDLFDIPSKDREEEIIKTLTNDVKKEIDKLINQNKDDS